MPSMMLGSAAAPHVCGSSGAHSVLTVTCLLPVQLQPHCCRSCHCVIAFEVEIASGAGMLSSTRC